MTPALLTLAILAQPECHLSPPAARRLAQASLAAGARHGLPAGLVAAVACAESGGRRVVAYRRGKGRLGCDVGPWQLHVPGCPGAVARLLMRAPLRDLAEASAWLLAARRDPAATCPWWRYNPGSVTWCGRVMDIYRRIVAYVQRLIAS